MGADEILRDHETRMAKIHNDHQARMKQIDVEASRAASRLFCVLFLGGAWLIVVVGAVYVAVKRLAP